MSRYILSRLVGLVPVIFFISLITFLSVALIPGSAAMVIAGDTATKKDIEAMSKRLELDLPLHIRYVRWLGRTLTGDLGSSLLTKQPVLSDIARALPVTLELALLGTLVSALIAFPIGIYAATHQGSWVDQSVMGVLLLGISVPTYVLSIVLILLFAVYLRVLPASGFTPFLQDSIQNLKQMVLPVAVVAIFQGAILARYVRSGMLEVLGQLCADCACQRARGKYSHSFSCIEKYANSGHYLYGLATRRHVEWTRYHRGDFRSAGHRAACAQFFIQSRFSCRTGRRTLCRRICGAGKLGCRCHVQFSRPANPLWNKRLSQWCP